MRTMCWIGLKMGHEAFREVIGVEVANHYLLEPFLDPFGINEHRKPLRLTKGCDLETWPKRWHMPGCEVPK